eukprot:1916803-Rhodomonas_salina.1
MQLVSNLIQGIRRNGLLELPLPAAARAPVVSRPATPSVLSLLRGGAGGARGNRHGSDKNCGQSKQRTTAGSKFAGADAMQGSAA